MGNYKIVTAVFYCEIVQRYLTRTFVREDKMNKTDKMLELISEPYPNDILRFYCGSLDILNSDLNNLKSNFFMRVFSKKRKRLIVEKQKQIEERYLKICKFRGKVAAKEKLTDLLLSGIDANEFFDSLSLSIANATDRFKWLKEFYGRYGATKKLEQDDLFYAQGHLEFLSDFALLCERAFKNDNGN